MFGLQWSERSEMKSAHPFADVPAAAQLIRELPLEDPSSALAEAAAWLESIEAETFTPSRRLSIVSMLDEAVHPSVESLTLSYIGARPGTARRAVDWRVLTDYLDRLGSAYCALLECPEMRGGELASQLPLVIVRAMRAITRGMKVSWLRYLPPDRGSWESLVRCYRLARGRDLTKVMATAYAADKEPSCPLYELTVGVMLAAAAPQSLTPRQVELAYRIATCHQALFTASVGRAEEWRHYLFDLDNPGTPARIPGEVSGAGDVMFFRAEAVLPPLKGVVNAARGAILAITTDIPYGREFGTHEKRLVLDHILRFWGDNPPSRRDARRRINSKIHVEVGAKALRSALEHPAHDGREEAAVIGAEGAHPAVPEPQRVAPVNLWTLTDFSTRGIGARFSRRLDSWLHVGSLVAFRLERSKTWCVAIVRRLRTDSRNQTDVGCEILAKAAHLVKLEGRVFPGMLRDLDGSGALVHTKAVALPEDPHLEARASLLFEPGTNAPGQTFVMHHEGSSRAVKLGAVIENIDGWDRVELDLAD